MYYAIGYNSSDVYMSGKTQGEVMQKLQKAYPTPSRNGFIYPEPLIIGTTIK